MLNRVKRIALEIIVAIAFVSFIGIAGHIESHYNMDAVVTQVENNEVHYVDVTGNEWIAYTDEYKVGENVSIKFDTNHTDENRKDDKIVKVKRL